MCDLVHLCAANFIYMCADIHAQEKKCQEIRPLGHCSKLKRSMEPLGCVFFFFIVDLVQSLYHESVTVKAVNFSLFLFICTGSVVTFFFIMAKTKGRKGAQPTSKNLKLRSQSALPAQRSSVLFFFFVKAVAARFGCYFAARSRIKGLYCRNV